MCMLHKKNKQRRFSKNTHQNLSGEKATFQVRNAARESGVGKTRDGQTSVTVKIGKTRDDYVRDRYVTFP